MEKMRMETKNIIQNNLRIIQEAFPQCITEHEVADGKISLGVDFSKLKKFLEDSIIDEDKEKYEFTWVGKKRAIKDANSISRMTLRPKMAGSENWDSTENLYIEGDNLEVLKLLQESYLNSVNVIYIDPPYNTGSDFIYRDSFTQSNEEYETVLGQMDDMGNRLFKNNDSDGRYHSAWCSMIYSRLLLARNLLSDDGVIFISIDDNEQENLKKIVDEVFGPSNFIAQVVWERSFSPVNLKKHFSESHDYILCYAKNIDKAVCNGLPRNNESYSRYSNPDNDERGPWTSGDLSVGPPIESKIYEIITPSGRKVLPPSGYCWRLDRKTFEEYVVDNRIWFGPEGNNVPRIKRFLCDVKQGMTPMTVWKFTEVGHSQDAKQKLKNLFGGKSYFDYPKSVELLKRFIRLYGADNSLILDFFSGSATTAQAVMEVNAEDGSNKRFIMVQLQEKCDEKTEAFKDGYATICDIGEARIRKAAMKILKEYPESKTDTGFRVFELADSYMNDVYYTPSEYSQNLLSLLESNIKPDRSDLDLLFGCVLDWGLPLSLPYSSEQIEGCTVHNYNDGDLIACFDENIPESVIKEIAKQQPLRAVFRDSCFKDSPAKINISEIFKLLAPETSIKVI